MQRQADPDAPATKKAQRTGKGHAREGDAAALAIDVRHLIGLHDQVDGMARAALHTGGTPRIHEQLVTAAALQLCHLRACTAAHPPLHISSHSISPHAPDHTHS